MYYYVKDKRSQIWSTLRMQLQYVYRKDLFMLRITRDVVIRVNLLNLLPSVAAPAPPQHECGLCPVSS